MPSSTKHECEHAPRRVLLLEYCAVAPDTGALAAEGRAIRAALLADLLTVPKVDVTVVIATGDATLPPGTRGLSAPRGACLPTLVAQAAARHDCAWVVAPECGGLLASFARAVAPARWLGCHPAAIDIAASKRATLDLLAARGLPTPRALDDATRWVVKPDDGAGAQATVVHATHDAARADFERRRACGASATLEPWVEGEARSLSLLCDAEGIETLADNEQCLELGADGVLHCHGVHVATRPPSATLRGLAARVARALPGLRGLVGIDYVQHARLGPVVIEVNPRPTSACVGLAAALGRSLAAEILRRHAREHGLG